MARAAQLEVLQAASARMSRATSIDEIGRTIVEETRGIIDYHNARVYLIEPPDDVVPIAFEGRVGAYEHVDMRCSPASSARASPAGSPSTASRSSSTTPTATRAASTIAGTEDVDESMLVVPMRYDDVTIGVITLSKLGLDGFGSDDLRLLTILADRAATAVGSARLLTRTQDLAGELRRLLDMSAELSGSLDPRQVADLMARHLVRAIGVDECVISYWDRAGRPRRVARLLPATQRRRASSSRSSTSPAIPETLRVLERQETVIVDADDPAADRGRGRAHAPATATASWPCSRSSPRASRSAWSS